MLAARLYDKNDLRLEEMPIPEIGSGEVLLKVRSTAICGTDIRMYRNGHKSIGPASPRVLGHELSGVIVATGSQVRNLREGLRVAVAPNIGCGVCNACIRGDGQLCRDYRALGINMDGGFAEYVRIPEEAVARGNISILPDNVSFDAAAVNEALSCVFNGFEQCRIRPGDSVLVIGAGPIGIMHAMLARMAGASKVFVNDLNEERLAVCAEIDPGIRILRSDGLQDSLLSQTGGEGVDACITACPAPSAQVQALQVTAINGRINFFGGLPPDRENVTLNTNLIHYKQLTVTGTTRASLLQYRKTLGFIASGYLDIDRLISHRLPLHDIETGFAMASDARGLKNVIFFE